MPRCFKSTTYKATVRPFQSTSTHIVFSTWVHKHFDNIPSRNRDSYGFSIRVVNRQRRFVQFESSGMHGSSSDSKQLFEYLFLRSLRVPEGFGEGAVQTKAIFDRPK